MTEIEGLDIPVGLYTYNCIDFNFNFNFNFAFAFAFAYARCSVRRLLLPSLPLRQVMLEVDGRSASLPRERIRSLQQLKDKVRVSHTMHVW